MTLRSAVFSTLLLLCSCHGARTDTKTPSSQAAALATPPRSGASAPKCPSGMAAIPEGAFPRHDGNGETTVRTFCLDVNEVTAGQYGACVRAGRCSEVGLFCYTAPSYGANDRISYPINCVDWTQAAAYCEAMGKRLPTDDEFEWAWRDRTPNAPFQWGSSRPERACWSRAEREGPCAVGSYPQGKSPEGVLDLAGNVWEWTSSDYRAGQKVIRGGGYTNEGFFHFWEDSRLGRDPSLRWGGLGFRCAASGCGSSPEGTACEPRRAPMGPPVVAEVSPFYVVARSDAGLDFIPGKPTLVYSATAAFELRDGVPSKPNPALLSHLIGRSFGWGYQSVDLLGGRWPDAAYAVVRDGSETIGCPSSILQWNGSYWGRVASPGSFRTAFVAMGPYRGGHLFAGHEQGCGGPMSDDPADPDAPGIWLYATLTAAPTPSHGLAGSVCRTRMAQVGALATLETGEVIVGGSECGEPPGAAVELWHKDGKSTFYRLSTYGTSVFALFARTAADVYASVGSPEAASLVHFDGSSWRAMPTFTSPLRDLAGDRRSLWAVLENGEVWTRSDAQSWQRVLLPSGQHALGVRIPSDGDVWVSTDVGLLHRAPPHPSVEVPAGGDSDPLPEATPDCPYPSIIVEPPDAEPNDPLDERSFAELLKGHVELKHTAFALSDDTIVSLSSDYDEAMGLMRLIRTKRPDATLRAICGQPVLRGPLPIDIARGVLRPAVPEERKIEFVPPDQG